VGLRASRQGEQGDLKGIHFCDHWRRRTWNLTVRCTRNVCQIFMEGVSAVRHKVTSVYGFRGAKRHGHLVFKMVDKDVPTYPHRGGIIAFTGNSEIPAGAFSYRDPCPPKGQQQAYEWTVQALDGKGKALASTTIVEKFPP
jgi:hypothetical protein